MHTNLAPSALGILCRRVLVSALLLMMWQGAGQSAMGQPAGDAASDGQPTVAGLFGDFLHYARMGRFDLADATAGHLEACHFKAGLSAVMNLARQANGYFDTTAPFRSRKTDMDACGRAVNVCVQTVRTLTTLMAPFLPFSARKCLTMLRLGDDALAWDQAVVELPPGSPLAEPVILFKKLDAAELFEA